MKIAVSSGHQASTIVAYADPGITLSAGRPFYVGVGDSLNLHCIPDTQTLASRLRAMLDVFQATLPDPLRARGFTADDRLVLSLPGVSSATDLARGKECIDEAGWPAGKGDTSLVVDDTYAGLIAGARCTHGICAFAGTGASVYLGSPSYANHQAFLPDKSFKLDGFGPMIGDHGSGFRLAMATLERMGRDLDEYGVKAITSLYEQLLKALKTDWSLIRNKGLQNGIDDLMASSGPNWRFKIADLGKVITAAAAAGDLIAIKQVTEAARAMGRTLRIGIDLFDDLDDAPIHCQGGMFRNSELYRRKVREYLNRPEEQVVLATYKPVVGALLLAAAQDWAVVQGDYIQQDILKAVESILPGDPAHALLFNVPG
jgi:N-acetylglucosamine kinase-like BadF-type ATPase